MLRLPSSALAQLPASSPAALSQDCVDSSEWKYALFNRPTLVLVPLLLAFPRGASSLGRFWVTVDKLPSLWSLPVPTVGT